MDDAASDIARLAELIQLVGYRAQIEDTHVRTAMSGRIVLVFLLPGPSIQTYFGISLDEQDRFGLDEANEFNQTFRFVKCYLRSGTVVSFEQDFYFDVAAPDARETLDRIFANWEVSIGQALRALREAQAKDAATSP